MILTSYLVIGWSWFMYYKVESINMSRFNIFVTDVYDLNYFFSF